MKKFITVILLIIFVITGASFIIRPTADEPVPYPEGFRKWTHVKTGLIGPNSPAFKTTGGFHHIYANDKAMEGYASGNFPQGSIFVFDVIEGTETDGNTIEGKRRHVDVMIKDSIRYNSTGGWGYEEFKGSSKTERVLTETVRSTCFKCHTSQPDYIFSDLRE
jgi:hypothetical protein